MKTAHRWFRVYTEIVHDRKVRRLAPAGRWLWIAILVMAKQSPDEGKLLLSDGVPVTVADLADVAGLSQKIVAATIPAMMSYRMLSKEGDHWIVLHWKERQFVSDDVAARVKRYRERSGNVTGNVSPLSTETETETETDPPTALTDADFARLQTHYEAAYALALTPTQAEALAELAEEFSLDDVLDAITEAARCGKTDTRYITAIVRRWAVEGRPPSKGGKGAKARRSDADPTERYVADNPDLFGKASAAEARRRIAAKAG